MRNKKGFTLIELLAVIVILAIIALIVTPIVLDTIDKANKNAFKNSAHGLISAGELYHSSRELDLEEISGELVFEKKAGSESLETLDGEKLKTNGSAPDGTILKINKNGDLAFAMYDGKYCITKSYLSKDFTLTEDTQENCVVPSPTFSAVVDTEKTSASSYEKKVINCLKRGEKCSAGALAFVKVNSEETYKFYVISDDKTTVNLIMAENLYDKDNPGEPAVAWYDSNDNSKGPLIALAALKARTEDWDYIQEDSYTLNDAGNHYVYDGDDVKNVRARLPKIEDLEKFCPGNSCESWLVDGLNDTKPFGFWLSDTPTTSVTQAWIVKYDKTNYKASAGHAESVVLRPVITISK